MGGRLTGECLRVCRIGCEIGRVGPGTNENICSFGLRGMYLTCPRVTARAVLFPYAPLGVPNAYGQFDFSRLMCTTGPEL